MVFTSWIGPAFTIRICVSFRPMNEHGNSLPSIRQVYHQFPRSQHRPVFLQVGMQIQMIHSKPVSRWNFRKVNWTNFATLVDRHIRWFKPDIDNFNRFTGVVIATAKKSIPRGFRKNYIPSWNSECEELWTNYQESGNVEIGAKILKILNEERMERCRLLVQNMDFKHSSKKAWHLLRTLSVGPANISTTAPIHPNSFASKLVPSSKVPISKVLVKRMKRKLKAMKRKI